MPNPPCTLNSLSDAKAHICDSEWFKKLERESANTKEETPR